MIATAAARKWVPHEGQQTAFLSSPAFEALFGGAAGPGKTECLTMEALRQVEHPKYTGIIFRRSFTQLEAANGVIQRSMNTYPSLGGRYNSQKHYWVFPSGARIYFGHMEHDGDEMNYDGPEYSFVGFDELTAFSEKQYLYMFSRCRPAGPGLRAYMRAATNPGNTGHRWVKRRFITRDILNRLRYFATVDEKDTEVDRSHSDALSRAFYPAKMGDNPNVDPAYRSRIRAMGDPVRIAQLEHGDWDAEYRDGLIYDTWTSTENVTSEAEYNPDLPVYWACDDGYVFGDGPGAINYHPRVVLFVQDNGIGGLNIFDEYLATEETHGTTLKNILLPTDGGALESPNRWQKYRRPTVAYVPSEAAMMRGELHNHGITTVNATHRVSEGIKAVRQLIVMDGGMRLLKVHPRCEHVTYEFTEYRSDPKGRSDTGEIVPMKVDDHTMDAARYLIYKRRHFTRG
jgi:hypothetical protein